jgi:hypothetical protein
LLGVATTNLCFAQATISATDRTAIAAHVARVNENAKRAWSTRDPTLLVPDSPAVFVRTPQGSYQQ